MIIAIHQPNYSPWAGYFYKLVKADLFIFLNDVQFSKNSFTNRTKVFNGHEYSWLTIPVKFNLGDRINQIKIAQEDWQQRHLSKIKNIYNKEPFFKENWQDIETLFNSLKQLSLYEVNKKIVLTIATWLNIKLSYKESSSLPNKEGLKSEDRLIDIIRQCNSKIYLSGAGAKQYQDIKKFNLAGVKLIYSDFLKVEKQNISKLKNVKPGTSIIELIFKLGRENTIKYLSLEAF